MMTPDKIMVKRVGKLRGKGLSFRQIAKLIDKDVKTVYRWFLYYSGKITKTSAYDTGKQ